MNPHFVRNMVGGGLALAIASVAINGGWHMHLGSLRRIGQGAFPLGIGLLLAVLGLALMVSGVKAFLTSRTAKSDSSLPAMRPVLCISAAMIAFALILPHAGLLCAVAAATILSALGSSESRKFETLALAIVLPLIFAGLFVYGLALPISLLPW